MDTPLNERDMDTGDETAFRPAPLTWLFTRFMERFFRHKAPPPNDEPFEEHINGLA